MDTDVTPRPRLPGGWTLVDALLATLFLALMAAVVHSVVTTSLHVLGVRQAADDLDETARIALEIMARDIRDAGYGLVESADRGLRVAGQTRIRLARDLDLDGETASSNEIVSYSLDDESGQLRRQLGNAAPQPMVESLDSGQVLFRYFDDRGMEVNAEDTDLENAQRAIVRQVEITLRLSSQNPAPGASGRIVVQHRTSVGLRNGQI